MAARVLGGLAVVGGLVVPGGLAATTTGPQQDWGAHTFITLVFQCLSFISNGQGHFRKPMAEPLCLHSGLPTNGRSHSHPHPA